MNCGQLDPLWPLWTAGDLNGRKRAAFEAHLAGCPGCQARAQAFDEASDLARDLLRQAGPALSPAERARLVADLGEQRRPRRWSWALAATCAAALVAWLVWTPTGRGPQGQSVDAGQVLDADRQSQATTRIALVDAADRAERYELRLATSDPTVKIVWVFDRNLNI